jgi:sec-independent protein translocase protein TatA
MVFVRECSAKHLTLLAIASSGKPFLFLEKCWVLSHLSSRPAKSYTGRQGGDHAKDSGGKTVNIFGIGLPEMALIFIVALLIFGPKKLPEIGRSLGKAIKGFQDASREFQEEFKKEAEQIEKVVNTSMEAKLEPPTPKALSATETQTEEEKEELVEPELITDEAVAPSQQG